MNRTSTILPPPSDAPVPMPEPARDTPVSGEWRSLVEITKDTIRPGTHVDAHLTETVRPGGLGGDDEGES